MKRKWLKFILTGVFVAGLVGTSYADVKMDGELRIRGVMVNNKDAAAVGTSGYKQGGFFEQRTRLNAGADVDENTKVFIQAQDSRGWGSEASTTTSGNGVQGLDLSQGYIEMNKIAGQPLSLRLGRQALNYGDARLIGSLEWSNNARRFDAVKFTYTHDIANVDVFWAKVMDLGGDYNKDNNLLGVYATLNVIPGNNLDVYLLDKLIAGGTDIKTFGARVKGDVKPVNVDYNAEIAIQSGDVTSTVTQSANAYALKAGYTIPDVMGLRVGVEYDSATGDKASTATKVEAFDNLYPTNHYLYGFTDDVNLTNIKAMSIGASINPKANVKVAVEYWKYTKSEKVGGKDDMGSELNLKVNHEMSKKVNCELAYALRDAGDIATAAYPSGAFGTYGTTPVNKNSSLAYFMINVKFN